MPRSHKDPPAYSKAKPYARWKTETNLWADMVKANETLKPETLGQIVALNALPDGGPDGDIRGTVIDALGDTLKGANGLKTLLAWMDEHMGRDEVQSCVDKASTFMKYRRGADQDMKEYLAGFDAKYKAAKGAGLGDMGQIFLMWMVIEHAGVSPEQFQLVLSQIDLESKDTLYDNAKAGLTKFFAGISCSPDGNKDKGIKLKESDTFFARRGGWTPKPPYQPRFPIRSAHTPRPGGAGAGAYSGAGTSFGPRTPVSIPRNPIRNGRQDLCDICGTWTHYRRDCPFNPSSKAAMYGDYDNQDNGDNVYLYNGEHTFVSEVPDFINDDVPADTGQSSAPVDHVTALLATLADKKTGPEEEVKILLTYTLNTDVIKQGYGQVVLDSGCVKSVGSTVRVNGFINTLHPATRAQIKVEPSSRVFKFGGGQKRKSVGTFYIPCSLNNKNIVLVMDAVEQDDLPLLLSKESMKKAGVTVDYVNDTAMFFNQKVQLKENEAGHYVIQLADYIHGEEEWSVMWSSEGKDDDEAMEDLARMHHGMGHPSQKSFELMLKNDGSLTKNVHDLVNKLYKLCVTCYKFKKSKPIPKVAPPMSRHVNDCMTIDLKLYPKLGKNVMYMIDDFSRYVTAAVIHDKEAVTITKEFLDKWVFGTPYGPPSSVHTDNGTEFVNKVFREMTEKLGIRHTTTGSFSPFSNGLNERNHHTVDLMMEKIMEEDEDISFEDALAKAVYAKNTMLNVHGFSPAQILTGRQPRLPGATNDNRPPQDEAVITSRTVYDQLNLMQKARDAWVKVDNGNRLQRAMQVKPSPLEYYETGDMVYYRFGKDPRWHGPGRIVGQENKVVLIRHGGHIISTSQTRVFRAPRVGEKQMAPAGDSNGPERAGTDRAAAPLDTKQTDSDSEYSSDSDDETPATAAPAEEPAVNDNEEGEEGLDQDTNGSSPESPLSPERSQALSDQPSVTRPEPRIEAGTGREIFQLRPDQLQTEKSGESPVQSPDNMDKSGELLLKKRDLPKKGNHILYKRKEDELWFRAQIIKKGVKSNNPMPYYNVQPEFENRPKGINLDNFDWVLDSPESARDKIIFNGKMPKSPNQSGSSPRLRRNKEHSVLFTTNYAAEEHADQILRAEKAERMDNSYVVFIPKEDWDKPFVQEAMEKELGNFRAYGAYEEVEDIGQPRMSSGWIFTEKPYGAVIGAKGRLVVHGNQEGFSDSCDSPTVSKQSLRLQFSLAAQFGWELVMADVTSAFLQSEKLDREVYVQPPKLNSKPGIIWRILKPMYGLGDASLQWYKTLANKLIKLGCKRLTTDPAMFYWLDSAGQLGGILCLHVDDLIACGKPKYYEEVLSPLLDTFTFGSTSEGEYRCLGWNVSHKDGDILVSQKDYITTKVEAVDINTSGKDGMEKLGIEDTSKVRASIGKLRWLADQCRPDIAYSLLELSIQAHAPTYETVKLVNKTVARVKQVDYTLRYSKLNTKDWTISVFTDASLRGLPDKTSSAMGYIILLSEGYKPGQLNKACVLAWKSCKTKRIVASTYDAETLALTGGLEEAIFIRDQMSKLLNFKEDQIKIEAFCDCNDTVEAILANKPLPNKNSRLAALEIARIKEMRELGMLHDIVWIPTRFQLADSFTKRGVNIEPLVETLKKGRFSL